MASDQGGKLGKRSYHSITASGLRGEDGVATPLSLLKCNNRNCESFRDTDSALSVDFSPQSPFIAQIRCLVCREFWRVCVTCPQSRKIYKTDSQVARHIRDHHRGHYEKNLRQRSTTTPCPKASSPALAETSLSPGTLGEATSLPPGALEDTDITSGQVQDNLREEAGIDDFMDEAGEEPILLDGDDGNNFAELEEAEAGALAPRVPYHAPLTCASDISGSGLQATREFFFRDQDGSGLAYLAGKAQFGRPNIPTESLDQLEVKMLMQTAELAALLSVAEREKLANYTQTVSQVVSRQTLEDVEVTAGRQDHRPWTLYPITDSFQMKRQMKEGSKDSYMQTVPRVNVLEVGQHAVSLPSDCLQDLAGHGFPLDFVQNRQEAESQPKFPITSISTTSKCKKLFDDINGFESPIVADYNVYMFEWSDDFEGNTSLTKATRSGVWVKTLTIAPPDSHRHLMAYTYPIIMGPKNVSHEEAELVILDDLKRMTRPEGILIYSKLHQGLIRIRAKLLVSLQDQPERRGENHLLAGSSTLHKRFGWSFPWQKFATTSVLRPCAGCRAILFDTEQAWECPINCPDCSNFAYDPSHPLLKHNPESVGMGPAEGPLRLDYDKLAACVKRTHESFVDGSWDPIEADRYLEVHCITETTRESILMHADKCKEFLDAMEGADSSDALKNAVTEEKRLRPELYKPWPLPAIWIRGVHLDQHPDVPMHLLCLGIVKSVMLRIDKWLTRQRKAAPFARKMKGMLESIQELNLSWCLVLPYKGGKFGGWVSENYLAMSRVMKWFYSALDIIAPDGEQWLEPQGEMPSWTGEDCKKWLGLRGLAKKGLAHEVRLRVGQYREKPLSDQPPVVAQLGGPVADVQNTVIALDSMVSWLMVERIDGDGYFKELERKIRVFLTAYAEMDVKLTKKGATPTWLTAFNFLSLLNVPHIVREYGPFRNIWEGYWRGEGYLRFVKPSVTHGLRKYWERTTMTSLMRKKGMGILVGKMTQIPSELEDASDSDDEVAPVEKRSKLFRRHRGTTELDQQLRNSSKVISCIVVDNQLGVACDEFGQTRFVPLTQGHWHTSKMNLDYFFWLREERPMIQGLETADHAMYQVLDLGTIEAECMLLPLIQLLDFNDVGHVRGAYAVVDRQHRALDGEETFRR